MENTYLTKVPSKEYLESLNRIEDEMIKKYPGEQLDEELSGYGSFVKVGERE